MRSVFKYLVLQARVVLFVYIVTSTLSRNVFLVVLDCEVVMFSSVLNLT